MRYSPFSSERTQFLPGRHERKICSMKVKNFQSGLNKFDKTCLITCIKKKTKFLMVFQRILTYNNFEIWSDHVLINTKMLNFSIIKCGWFGYVFTHKENFNPSLTSVFIFSLPSLIPWPCSLVLTFCCHLAPSVTSRRIYGPRPHYTYSNNLCLQHSKRSTFVFCPGSSRNCCASTGSLFAPGQLVKPPSARYLSCGTFQLHISQPLRQRFYALLKAPGPLSN